MSHTFFSFKPIPKPTLPKVVNVKVKHLRKSSPHYNNLRAWMEDPQHEYVGRGKIVDFYKFPPESSIWANPFKSPRDGTIPQVLANYKSYITQKIKDGEITLEQLSELRKKRALGCWCVDQDTLYTADESEYTCHAQVLLNILANMDT